MLDRGARCRERTRSWAPWWLYVIVAFPSVWGVQTSLSGDASWSLRAGVALAVLAANVAVITAVQRWRRARRDER